MKTKTLIKRFCNMFYWSFAAGVTFSGACMLIWPDTCYRAFACLTLCCLLCILFDWLEGKSEVSKNFDYCPNCGAMMKEGEKNE